VRTAERYVLDSFALLAYLQGEPGAERVESILTACGQDAAAGWMSIVNYGEVLYITERGRGLQAAQRVVATVDQLPINVTSADRRATFMAAHVKAHYAISYADAFAVALAHEVSGCIVTGDPEFERVEDLAPMLWIP